MERYEIKIDNTTYEVDGISFEYAQQDSEQSGRSDDGTMYRDVAGLANKVYCDFKNKDKWKEQTLSNLLKELKKTSCSFNYYDALNYQRITRDMYLVADKVQVDLINGEFVAQPFQIRFIQMDLDDVDSNPSV